MDGVQVVRGTSTGGDGGRGPGRVASSRRDHLERAVLQVLWDHPEGIAATQVVADLRGRDVAVTTVLTVLERLRRKGLVTRWRSGRSYLHRATATREESAAAAMLNVLDQGADRPATLARLVAVADPDDLAALREALLTPVRSGGEVGAPVCGPGLGAASTREGAQGGPTGVAAMGCGGASGLCGCCTCEPGCACCTSPVTTG